MYYKPLTNVHDDSRGINKLEASLTDNARVVIYNCQMFIAQATGGSSPNACQFFFVFSAFITHKLSHIFEMIVATDNID